MSALSDFFETSWQWMSSSLWQIIFSVVTVVVVYVGYKLFVRQIIELKEDEKLEENVAFTLRKIFRWVAGLIILAVIFAQFGIELGVVAGLLALAGGTIVGFAAMNTIGNALAGIIVMTSRPFKIGDRILFQGLFADVVAIDLIYTRLKTLDNVSVYIPNQELLKSEIDNYGKRRIIRRSCTITAGYELDFEYVQKALITAASNVEQVLNVPNPYVRITAFKDFAVEYTLYVFVNDIRRLREIDADLRKTVLETCKSHKIDISTPRLLRSV